MFFFMKREREMSVFVYEREVMNVLFVKRERKMSVFEVVVFLEKIR